MLASDAPTVNILCCHEDVSRHTTAHFNWIAFFMMILAAI